MIIETPRLQLREFVEADWPEVLAYQTDSRYLTYYPWTGRTEAEVRAFVAQFVQWQAADPRIKFQLAITLRGGGALIGNCGVRLGEAGARAAETGFEIAPEHWGQGYATEAAWAMAAFGFDELQLRRVYAECVPENVASRRVMEKLGMRCVGRLRATQWYKGRWWDTLVYSLLDREWRAKAAEAQLADRAAKDRADLNENG